MNKLFLFLLVVVVALAAHDRPPRAHASTTQVPHPPVDSVAPASAMPGAPERAPVPVYPAFSVEEMQQTKEMLEKHNQGSAFADVVVEDEEGTDFEEEDAEDTEGRKRRDRAWAFWGFVVGGVAAIVFTICHIKRSRKLQLLIQQRRAQMNLPLNPPTLNLHELIAYHQGEVSRLQAMLAQQQRPTVEWQHYPAQYAFHETVPQQSPYESRVYDVEPERTRPIPVGRPVQAEMPLRYPQFD